MKISFFPNEGGKIWQVIFSDSFIRNLFRSFHWKFFRSNCILSISIIDLDSNVTILLAENWNKKMSQNSNNPCIPPPIFKHRQFFQLLLKKIRQIFPYVQQTLLEDGKEKKVEISPRRSPRNANSRLVFHILERHECIRGWKKLKCPRKFIRVPLQGYTMLKIDLENTRTIFLTKKKKKIWTVRLLRICCIYLTFITFSSLSLSPSVHEFIFENSSHSLLAFYPFRFTFISFN